MDKVTKKYIIVVIILILVFYFANSYTTSLFNSNKYNQYNPADIHIKESKDIVKSFIQLILSNKFDEAYSLLNEKTKNTFNSPNGLKEYFEKNYSNVNRQENGILVVERYNIVGVNYDTYNCMVISEKYKAPNFNDPYYSEIEFNIFNNVTVYKRSPIDYNIEINI